jgi:hypothetical protein
MEILGFHGSENVVCGLAGGYQSFGGTYCLPEDEGDMFL